MWKCAAVGTQGCASHLKGSCCDCDCDCDCDGKLRFLLLLLLLLLFLLVLLGGVVVVVVVLLLLLLLLRGKHVERIQPNNNNNNGHYRLFRLAGFRAGDFFAGALDGRTESKGLEMDGRNPTPLARHRRLTTRVWMERQEHAASQPDIALLGVWSGRRRRGDAPIVTTLHGYQAWVPSMRQF